MKLKVIIEESNETAIGYGVTLEELSLEVEKYLERRRKDGYTIKINTFIICYANEIQTREEILQEFYDRCVSAKAEFGDFFLQYSSAVKDACDGCEKKLSVK
jgi:hypothetical protein